jgi:hypothetical protein
MDGTSCLALQRPPPLRSRQRIKRQPAQAIQIDIEHVEDPTISPHVLDAMREFYEGPPSFRL